MAHYLRGIITGGEFAQVLMRTRSIWHQVWSGAAAHRAGVDWIGHLLIAASRGCPVVLQTALPSYYLDLRGELRLAERVWSRTEGDEPSLYGDGWTHRRYVADEQLRAIGWYGEPDRTDADDQADRTHQPWVSHTFDLEWIGWMGNTLQLDDVADAAWQTAVGDGAPLVAKFADFANYVIVHPEFVTLTQIEATDLVNTDSVSLRRSFTSPTGWRLCTRFWADRN